MATGPEKIVTRALAGAGTGAAALVVSKAAAGALVPYAMSFLGIVVKGVGTLIAAGGVVAFLQSFAATGILPQLRVVVPIGAILGVVICSFV